MVRECHTPRQPLQNILQGTLNGGRRPLQAPRRTPSCAVSPVGRIMFLLCLYQPRYGVLRQAPRKMVFLPVPVPAPATSPGEGQGGWRGRASRRTGWTCWSLDGQAAAGNARTWPGREGSSNLRLPCRSGTLRCSQCRLLLKKRRRENSKLLPI